MATVFSNTLQQGAAKIAKASLSTRLQVAYNYAQTISNLPGYRTTQEATDAVNRGRIASGAVYYNEELGTLAVAKGLRKKLPPKGPIKQL
jgi:hypothetical protein